MRGRRDGFGFLLMFGLLLKFGIRPRLDFEFGRTLLALLNPIFVPNRLAFDVLLLVFPSERRGRTITLSGRHVSPSQVVDERSLGS